jgi:acyl-CoA synthetase (AMP-forming)/AMP-acid ligase II
VDEKLWPVPAGAEGELVIGGPGVGPGYVGRPDLTAEKFVQTPFDGPDGAPALIYRSGDLVRLDAVGDIEFIGRIDTQVKIRGFRVELGEIEAVIADDPPWRRRWCISSATMMAPNSSPLSWWRAGGTVDLDAARARARTAAQLHAAIGVSVARCPAHPARLGQGGSQGVAAPRHHAR